MMRLFTLFGCLFLVFVPGLSASQDCSQEAVQRAAADVKTIRNRLLAVKLEESGMDTDVTPSTQEQIRAIKDALGVTVAEFMRCQSGNAVDEKIIEESLAHLLGANENKPAARVPFSQIPEIVDHVYGSELKISVARPDRVPRLLAMKASFKIACGEDTMLLIYDWRDGSWRQVLRWQSGDYAEISGAFGDFFQYVLLPRGSSGKWAVAVFHGHPWCTSRYSGFDLDVIEPKADASHPHVLVHKYDGYVRDTDPVLKATPYGFELCLEKTGLDADLWSRKAILRYRVATDKVQRVQPVANNGRDFVDEWLQSDWNEAASWSKTANATVLKEVHKKMAALRDPKSESPSPFSYGPVRSCSDDPRHFQVQLDQGSGAATFFQIIKGQNSFTMLSASPTPDLRCTGADLMRKR